MPPKGIGIRKDMIDTETIITMIAIMVIVNTIATKNVVTIPFPNAINNQTTITIAHIRKGTILMHHTTWIQTKTINMHRIKWTQTETIKVSLNKIHITLTISILISGAEFNSTQTNNIYQTKSFHIKRVPISISNEVLPNKEGSNASNEVLQNTRGFQYTFNFQTISNEVL